MTTKRVLVCSPVMPAFDRESGSRRIFHLIEFLKEAGWDVAFAADYASGAERYVKILQQRGVATFLGFTRIAEVIDAGRFDLAILAFWYTAEKLMPTIRALSPTTRVIVDTVDLHFVRNARGSFIEPSGLLDLEYASDMAREVNTYVAADGVLTVSQKEADLINDLIGDPTLAHVVPDGEHLPPSALPFAERKGILFIGNFWHPPNIEAAQYLCGEILPRLDPAVMAEHPVYVVGNGLNETIRSYAAGLAHVRMVGWVPSVVPYLQRARISVVPLLYGAGTKRKIIQALMIGTPTVSTSMGVEGLSLQDGEHVLVADDPTTFANSIARLLKDEELWQHLAHQGRTHIMVSHGRKSARMHLMHALSAVLAKREVETRDIVEGDSRLHLLRVNEYNERLEEREARIQRLAEGNEALKASNEELKAYADALEARLHDIERSRIWRLFGPYRRLRIKLQTKSVPSEKPD